MYEAADPDQLDPLRMSFIRTLRIVRRHVTGQAGFPLTDSPPAFDTPSPRSSPAPTRPGDSGPTLASPNEPAEPNSRENDSTTTTSGTERHPTSDLPAYKVNGIAIRAGAIHPSYG
jgi:hypothetical protein